MTNLSASQAIPRRPMAPSHLTVDRSGLTAPRRPRHVVGIGELAVSDDSQALIVTHALGSCIAVCIWDPATKVGGLLHYLLPESRINPARAAEQPAAFADTGMPVLFQTSIARGLLQSRCIVRIIGGAEVAGVGGAGSLNVGRRNILAAKNLLWKHGVLIKGEAVGGTIARTVTMHLDDGRIQVTNGGAVISEL